MGLESTHTKVSGGGSVSSVADLQSDWRRKVDDELRDALKALDDTIDRDAGEFTAKDAVGIWGVGRSATLRKCNKLVDDGKLTVRGAYDPEVKMRVNAYKKV